MKRRNFIKNTSVAGLSLTALSFASCNTTATTSENNEIAVEDKFQLNEVTIDELQNKIRVIKNQEGFDT